MKKTLFRGFHKNEECKEEITLNGKKIKGEWIEGYYLDGFICGEVVDWDSDYIAPEFWCKVILETVGQCVGKADKTGKKIFDGDMLIDSSDADIAFHLIEWNLDNCGFSILSYGTSYGSSGIDEFVFDESYVTFEILDELQIIGNKFSNPEFLEEVCQ